MSTNNKANKEASKTSEEDDVVDARETTAVATTENTAVSSQVTVQGVSLSAPFVRIGQAMSTWRCEGRAPMLGAFYIVKDKSTVTFLADAGAQGGINGILLEVVPGILEDKQFTSVMNPPRRWVGDNAIEEAAKEGITLEPRPTGEVWPDSGKPRMRANGSRFCYLRLLAQVPDAFDMGNYQMFPIGDHLYTPIHIEFNKVAFKELESTISNIERVDKFRHRNDANYKFTWNGKLCRIFSVETVSRQTGATYPQLRFGLSTNEMTANEKADFVSFLQSVTPTKVDASAVGSGDLEA